MIPLPDLLVFALAALGLVLTPGPNMIYLLSRSICQGRKAGVISLGGVLAGFTVHILAAALGLTAVLFAIPFLYTGLKYAGAGYLLWLAWQAVRPGSSSALTPRDLPPDSPGKLFRMGFLTNALNPKMAVFYLSLFPQFIRPEAGSPFVQSLQLGFTQVLISFSVNLLIVLGASRLAAWFATRPLWLKAQRWVMGTVLTALALRMVVDKQK